MKSYIYSPERVARRRCRNLEVVNKDMMQFIIKDLVNSDSLDNLYSYFLRLVDRGDLELL
jgi:hypothetical protein